MIHLRKSYYLTLHLDADIVAIDYLMINLSIAVLLTHATKGEINNVLHGLLTAQNSFLLFPNSGPTVKFGGRKIINKGNV